MSNIDKLKPGKYAILFRNNWDGEGDTYETFAILDAGGIWRDEDGDELLEYQGDEVISAWPMDDGSNVLALLDELEAKDKRIAELERDETQLIEERDSAEKALADMYEAAMGERPEWSNLFGYAEAIDDVAQHINFLDLAAVTGKGE